MSDRYDQSDKIAQQLSVLTGCQFISQGQRGVGMPLLSGIFLDRELAQQTYRYLKDKSKLWGISIEALIDKEQPEEIQESKTSTFYERRPNLIPDSQGRYRIQTEFLSDVALKKMGVHINKAYEETQNLAEHYERAIQMCEHMNKIHEDAMKGWIAPPTNGWLVYGDQTYHPNVLIHYTKPHIRLYFTPQASTVTDQEREPVLQQILLQLIDVGFQSARHGHLLVLQGQPSADYISLNVEDATLAKLFHAVTIGDRGAISVEHLTKLDRDIRFAYSQHGGILFVPPQSTMLKNLVHLLTGLR